MNRADDAKALAIRPDVESYLKVAFAPGAPSIVDQPPGEVREMLRHAVAMIDEPARAMRRADVSVPSHDGFPVPARIYRPNNNGSPAIVIVFYHGGGWVLGDVEGYDPLCSEIAHQLAATVVSVDYRLAPEHLFPAAVEDSLAVTRWVASSPPEIGHPVSGLVLAGDSAGGALAAVVAREVLGVLPVPVLAQWLMYPVTDLCGVYASDTELSAMFNLTDEGKDRFFRYYLGDEGYSEKKKDPRVSPLLADTWDGLPPAVILTCALDPLRDQGRAYAAKLAANGIDTILQEAKGQIHACLTMRRALPSAKDDLAHSVSALKVLLSAVRRADESPEL